MRNTTIQEVYTNLLNNDKLHCFVNLEKEFISIKLNDFYELKICKKNEFEISINELPYDSIETEELYDTISELTSEDFVVVQRNLKGKFYDFVLLRLDELDKYAQKWKKNFALNVFNINGTINV